MWVNAMARAAERRGLSIPELLAEKRRESERKPKPSKQRVEPRRKDPFVHLSTRELYVRRPVD